MKTWWACGVKFILSRGCERMSSMQWLAHLLISVCIDVVQYTKVQCSLTLQPVMHKLRSTSMTYITVKNHFCCCYLLACRTDFNTWKPSSSVIPDSAVVWKGAPWCCEEERHRKTAGTDQEGCGRQGQKQSKLKDKHVGCTVLGLDSCLHIQQVFFTEAFLYFQSKKGPG